MLNWWNTNKTENKREIENLENTPPPSKRQALCSQYRESPKLYSEQEGENNSSYTSSEDPDQSKETLESTSGSGTSTEEEFDPVCSEWTMGGPSDKAEDEAAANLTAALPSSAAKKVPLIASLNETDEQEAKGLEVQRPGRPKSATRMLRTDTLKRDYKNASPEQLALWRAMNLNPDGDYGWYKDDLSDLKINPSTLEAAVEVGEQRKELQGLIASLQAEVQQAQKLQAKVDECTAASIEASKASKAATDELVRMQQTVLKGITAIDNFAENYGEIKKRLTDLETRDGEAVELAIERQAHQAVEKIAGKSLDLKPVRAEIGRVHNRVDEVKKDFVKLTDWRYLEHLNKKQIQILDFDVKKVTKGARNEDDLEKASDAEKLTFTKAILKEIWKEYDESDIAKVLIQKYKGDGAKRGEGANAWHPMKITVYFMTEYTAQKILGMSRLLKDAEVRNRSKYNVRPPLTPEQRERENNLRDELLAKNLAEDSTDHSWIIDREVDGSRVVLRKPNSEMEQHRRFNREKQVWQSSKDKATKWVQKESLKAADHKARVEQWK